jgi:hypothetical protein
MQNVILTGLITAGVCFAVIVTFGQVISDWWQLKRMRLKFLRQQETILDALKVAMDTVKEAREEIDSIGTIIEEELLAHERFLKSLKFVRPVLKNSPEFLSSHTLAATLTRQLIKTTKSFIQDAEFSEEDLRGLGSFMASILEGLRYDLEELEILTSDGILAMKDNERHDKIRATAASIRATYEAGMSFLLQLEEKLLVMQENANDEFLKKHL